MWNFRIGVFVLVALTSSAATCEELLQYGAPVELCRLKNKKVNESSGLAASRRSDKLFWTHNDSGDKARIYCFDLKGKHHGTCKMKNAGAIDWEDMCSFDIGDKPKLLIADIGDNGVRRKSCRLYLADEPSDPSDDIDEFQVIKLRYSTGPIDCEAIGVDPVSNKLLLVEKKRWVTCRVFEASFPLDASTGLVTGEADDRGVIEIVAGPIAKIALPLVTAMDVSPDGRRAIVMTLGQAFEFRRGEKEEWKAAFARKPRIIDMPARKQGEAICYGKDGRDLFLTSEMRPTPFYKVPVIE